MSDETGKDYKATLNLPQTEFPMKGNLAQLEPKMLAQWEERNLFGEILKKNEKAPLFVFHDGPPYANGHLHAGHALNKVLKDIVVKYRNLAGHKCDFVPGWDCHGLPIEQAVEKRLREKNIDKRTMSKDEFLAKCREYALEYIDIQRAEFKRMGVLARWNEPYETLTFDYEAQEIRELATFARNGSLYRKKKPVYWCITDGTALAEAEVEYDEHHVSPSIYVAFEAATDLGAKWPALKGKSVAFAIWTTTPWTLPANLAITVHPEFEYVFYQLPTRVVVVAKGLLLRFLSECAPEELKVKDVKVGEAEFSAAALVDPTRVLGYASGEELSGLTYKHVWADRVSPILVGEHVTLEQGTGLVHTAPGHGVEDYQVGLAFNLDIYNPVKNDGRYDDTVGEKLAGMKVWDANPVVIDWLVELGALLNPKGQTVTHSYPACWRCHNPIIFRATHQWFISMEKNDLRKNALREIDEVVKWVPAWGRDRIRGMLETRPDWCISRQRTWGVPIAIALCAKCDEPVVDQCDDAQSRRRGRKRSERGVWYRTDVREYLPNGYTCACNGSHEFRKRDRHSRRVVRLGLQLLGAGSKRESNCRLPFDLYLEGSDQHRGWFHSSLLVGTGTRGMAPYKTCLTHGFVVDGKGNKMSKSMGNVVAPDEIIKQFGGEVMRLWVASSDYRDDVRLSKDILTSLGQAYAKIRNTVRYGLSNLPDFDPAKDAVPLEQMQTVDRWVLSRLSELVTRVRAAYESYEFHTVFHAVNDFCVNDLSSVYFSISKDALYTSKKTGPKRRSAQTALDLVTRELLVLLAPIISFTADEAWAYLPGEKPSSVFLSSVSCRARGARARGRQAAAGARCRAAAARSRAARQADRQVRRRQGGAVRRRQGKGVSRCPRRPAALAVHRQRRRAGGSGQCCDAPAHGRRNHRRRGVGRSAPRRRQPLPPLLDVFARGRCARDLQPLRRSAGLTARLTRPDVATHFATRGDRENARNDG